MPRTKTVSACQITSGVMKFVSLNQHVVGAIHAASPKVQLQCVFPNPQVLTYLHLCVYCICSLSIHVKWFKNNNINIFFIHSYNQWNTLTDWAISRVSGRRNHPKISALSWWPADKGMCGDLENITNITSLIINLEIKIQQERFLYLFLKYHRWCCYYFGCVIYQ